MLSSRQIPAMPASSYSRTVRATFTALPNPLSQSAGNGVGCGRENSPAPEPHRGRSRSNRFLSVAYQLLIFPATDDLLVIRPDRERERQYQGFRHLLKD